MYNDHDDLFHDECGIFGVFGHPDATTLTALGLHALQHRGQEAAGIVSYDGKQFHSERRLGLVGDNFTRSEIIDRLSGHNAIGHVRYATSGDTILRNVQPLFAELSLGGMAIAHNGNLTNAYSIKKELVRSGSIFQSTSDTEAIIHLCANQRDSNLTHRLMGALARVEGAFSLLALTAEGVIGVRDPLGVRPLVIGKLDDAFILSSESCALDIIGASLIREVEPGEMVVINEKGLSTHRPFGASKPSRFCIFEYVYFARPDSVMEGHSVYDARKNIGKQLAKESPADVDMIVPVPDSGVPSAIGFAEQSGIPFELGIIRNHYVGRTFIEPSDQIRHFGVKLKHNANKSKIDGKRILLVDDSIVRGTTSMKIVEMVREAGAAEVHLRIASPPTTNSCFYGVDTPEREKLLASRYDIPAMAKHIGVDSLAFISIDGLYRAMGEKERQNSCPQYCDACFTGDYPTSLTDIESGDIGQNANLLSESQ